MRHVPFFGLVAVLAVASATNSAFAVTNYTETFNTNASNWLNVDSTAPTYYSSGGVDGSGYISHTRTFTSLASGPFGAPPLQVMMRGNDAANASGDAFVGNWLADGVESLTVAVRHNYTSTLNLYARLDAGGGAAASLAFDPAFAIAPNTWTTITIPIVNSNPPFLSYGSAGSVPGAGFNTIFSSMDNLQIGFYLPASTSFTDLTFDLDNVNVPEPASLGVLALGAVGLLGRRRRKV